MTRDEVAAIVILRVIAREGGVKDVGDGKGITAFGQTLLWLEEFGLPTPYTPEQAAANYRVFLERTRLMEVCDVLDALADAVIDYAVHSGHPRAIRALQAAIGTRPDGVIGDQTIAQLRLTNRLTAAARVIGDRNALLYRIIAEEPAHRKDAGGWAHRINEHIRNLVA